MKIKTKIAKHVCQHTAEGEGACLRCKNPLRPSGSRIGAGQYGAFKILEVLKPCFDAAGGQTKVFPKFHARSNGCSVRV